MERGFRGLVKRYVKGRFFFFFPSELHIPPQENMFGSLFESDERWSFMCYL